MISIFDKQKNIFRLLVIQFFKEILFLSLDQLVKLFEFIFDELLSFLYLFGKCLDIFALSFFRFWIIFIAWFLNLYYNFLSWRVHMCELSSQFFISVLSHSSHFTNYSFLSWRSFWWFFFNLEFTSERIIVAIEVELICFHALFELAHGCGIDVESIMDLPDTILS